MLPPWAIPLLLGALLLAPGRAAPFVARYTQAEIKRPDSPKDAMPLLAARLLAGREPAATLAAADRLMDHALTARLDPFDLHAIVHAERVARPHWPAPLRQRFRGYAARWDFTRPIGVSLNYELMRDGAGWIAADTWPDLVDAAGNEAPKIRALCAARLHRRLPALLREGSPEYGAPLYAGTDLMALRLLVDFADDPTLRDPARAALEAMLTETAAHWHRGYLISSAGRAKYWGSQQVSPDAPGATTAIAWMLFGGDRDARIETVPQGFWFAYPSPWLASLSTLTAWQAGLPVPRTVHESILIPSRKLFVRKQTWITAGYGLASQRTDGTPPDNYLFKESRNVLLRWLSPHPASVFIVFQENRRRPGEKIANAFAYGENPFAQTLQFEGTVLGVFRVPPDYGFHRLIAPFTTRGAILARIEREGWICAHGGTVLFAFRSLTPAKWIAPDRRNGLDLYATDTARGAWILETSPVAPFAGGGPAAELDRFATALTTRSRIGADLKADRPRLAFTNLSGHRLALTWQPPETPTPALALIDDQPLRFDDDPRLRVTTRSGHPHPLPPQFPSISSTSSPQSPGPRITP